MRRPQRIGALKFPLRQRTRGIERLHQMRLLSVHYADLVQWPAMIVTVLAAWFVASQDKRRRHWGFWLFIASNVLWVIWGWHARAWALIVLQFALFLLNTRGAAKNDPA